MPCSLDSGEAALIRELASSGPLYLAPVSPKSSKNTRVGRKKRMFFELVADTGAKKRGPELAGSLIKPSKGLPWWTTISKPQGKTQQEEEPAD